MQTSSASDERSYIEASSDPELYTLEGNFVFPFAAIEEYSRIPVTSSIFGLNEVDSATGIAVPANACGLVVEAIKSKVGKSGSRFKLRSKSAIFSDLETDYFADVFNNTTWSCQLDLSKTPI